MGTLFEVNGASGAVNFRAKGTSNLVLENRTSDPSSPVEGQLYWHSTNDALFVHNGTSFVGIGVGYNRVYNEVPTGLVNGSNTLFTLANAYVNSTTMVTRDGLVMKGGGVDYTETSPSAATITFTTAPSSGSTILVSYSRIEAAMLPSMTKFNCVVGTPSSTYTGSTTVFDLPFAYTVGNNALLVYASGVLMLKGATADYQETTSAQITFNSARTASEVIQFVKLGYNDATGEANTGSNVGSGTGLVFRDKIGTTLNFKTLLAGSGISISNNANDITINASVAAAGGWSDNTPHVDLSTATNQVRIGNGSAGTPALSFLSDTVTGMYRVGANQIGFSTNSANALTINGSQQLLATDGSAASPAYAFTNNTNLGMYRSAANNLSFATNATVALTLNSAQQTLVINGAAATPGYSFINDPDTGIFGDGSNSIRFTAGGVQQCKIDTTTFQVINSAFTIQNVIGTTALPSYTFGGDTNTGIFNDGTSGRINFSSDGTEVCRVENGQFRVITGNDIIGGTTSRIKMDNGTAALPSYTFSNDTDTGLYKTGTDNQLNITIGGTSKIGITTTLFDATPLIGYFADGTAAAPGYAFGNDTNTGFYRIGADNIGFTTGGAQRASLDSAGNFYVSQAVVGSPNFAQIENTNNTNTASHAKLTVVVGGTAGGDPYTQYHIPGGSPVDWSIGVDNSDSDKFKINNSSSLANGSTLEITAGNQILGLDGSAANPTWSFVNNTSSGLYNPGGTALNIVSGGSIYMNLASNQITPGTDNLIDSGSNTKRWANVWGTTIHSGDIELENSWRITEGDKVGHPEEGVMFLSPSGKKYKIMMTEVE